MKIQKAEDPNNLSSFEQVHLPWILVPEFVKKGEKFELTVKIGKVDHPMTSSHFIQWIGLYMNGREIQRKILRPKEQSEAKFNISLASDSVITARAECNLHGVWESEKRIVLYRG